MPRTAKIAISLPEDLLRLVEEERNAKGESRSEFFRRAIETLWQQRLEEMEIKRYLEGYRRMPESPEEIEIAHRAGSAILAEEPWE